MLKSNRRPVVLVTSVGAPPGLNTVRALKEDGVCEVIAADADPRAPALYQFQTRHIVLPMATNAAAYIDALRETIKRLGITVIIPCLEDEVLVLAAHLEELEAIGARVLIPTLEVVSKVTNKWTATRIAIENGINCPVSQLLSADQTAEERELVLQRFLFRCPLPWIIKPIRGHGMKGIIQVNSFDAAVKYTCLGSEDLLVQEFIPGSVGSMHLAGLLYNENGKVVRRFSSRSTRTLYPNGGPATAGISVNCPDMIENTETLVSALGVWKGPLNAEWMLDPRDGKLKFIEINPRMWGYGYLATGCGLNFPAGIVSLALGMDIGTDPGFLDGVTLLRSVTDLVFKESPFKLSV